MIPRSEALKKIDCPVLSSIILHREVPVSKLNAVLAGPSPVEGQKVPRYKLVVICTPAGYGKTTLLADFARHTTFPCCWYFLDREDADKTTFLTFLILSIRHQFPDFGKTLDPLLASAIATDVHDPSHTYYLEAVVDSLVTAIASEVPERFALFLCNYHSINNSQAINDIVNRLLQKFPPNCVLVIESRAVPDLDFASLLARNEILGFDQSLLRFSTTEIHDLAGLQGIASLQEREVEQLTTLFGGWIAGILLGTRLGDVRLLHSRKNVFTPSSMPDMHIDRKNLFAYLVNEVFSRDLEICTFLKDASVLQQMTPALCNTLLERTDAAECLHYVEEQGLFVTRSGDGSQTIYTCHPILRELFYDELRCQSPERFVALHRRAIEIWQAANNYEQAIYHAFEAGLDDLAARLILDFQKQMLAQGRVETLSRWIDTLLPETTRRYPQLLLIRAKVYLLSGEYMLALPLLSMASTAITTHSSLNTDDERPLLQAAIAIAQSNVLFQMGEYGQARQLCEQVIEQISVDEVMLHAEAHMRLGVCANVTGDCATGIAHLQKSLQLWGRNSEQRQTAVLHSTLASTYCLLGNFALAEHHLSRATWCWERLQDEWGKVDNLICIGLIKHRQGELDEAKAFFQEALVLARGSIHFRRGEAYALVNLGGLYQDQEAYEHSLTVTEDGLALARQMQDRYLINCALSILATTYLLMGDAETAMFLISEAKLETSLAGSSGYEKVMCELTRGTILIYQRRYDEASSCLSELKSSLRTTDLQREQLRIVLRLVECQLVQGQISGALRHIDEVVALIPRNDYDQLVLKELRFLPVLEHALKTLPELTPLCASLQLEMAVEKKPAEEIRQEPASVPSVIAVTSKAHIKILALGEPAILIDEKPVTRWRMARAMELLFFLLDSGRPLRKEQIITALWPEVDEHINQTLHSTIHYLRKSLGESCIASLVGTYSLNLASLYGTGVWYDIAEFQELGTKARQALKDKDDVVAQTALLAMVSLYRGDYVQSFYSDWCTFQRDKLRLAYLDARQQLALIAWRSEQYDESAIHWQHILAVDSCQEDAHYGLMRSYMRQGKRGLALRQYQRCVEVLRDELAIEPGQAIQNLTQHLIKPSTTR